MLCHEIVHEWDGSKRYVCEAERFTKHSHADGDNQRLLRDGERTVRLDTGEYLADGTRKSF